MLKDIKRIKVAPDVTAPTTWALGAGTSDVFSSIIDMTTHQGTGLEWLIDAGAIASTGGFTVTAQDSPDGTTFTDITGTAKTWGDADDDKAHAIIIEKVKQRYNRLKIVRLDAANSSVTQIEALIDGLRKVPVTQLTTAGQFVAQPSVVAP